MEKTAILGGSFDPVHLGHLYLLHNAMIQTDYTKFLLIPAKVSNFKTDSYPVSKDEDRLSMLRLAVEDFEELYQSDYKKTEVLDIEIKRGGVSYTYDTVMQIKDMYGINGRLGLIIGDDHLSALYAWHRFNELKEEVEFIICPRNQKGDLSGLPGGVEFRLLNIPQTREENATAVRRDFLKYGHYLSRRVFAYAKEKKLYC